MKNTTNDTKQQPAAEHPLTWTSSKVWGSVGMTHDATTEINGETWAFRVDSPDKGHWVARAWRDGEFALYREDRTMKGAKAAAQAQANYAATSTCTECRFIGGHTLSCNVPYAETYQVQDETVIVLKDECAQLLKLTEGMAAIVPAVDEFSRSLAASIAKVQAARDRVQLRADTCGCKTPLHTMRCGTGGHVRVVTKAGA